MSYTLKINKESFKFSAAHFAIFGPHSAERMHGHNYYVSFNIQIEQLDPSLGMSIELNELKPILQAICTQLDEYILLPEKSPFLKLTPVNNNIEVTFNEKFYSFPVEDVQLLPLLNISIEELSRLIHKQAICALKDFSQIKSIAVEVQETKGQTCLFEQRV